MSKNLFYAFFIIFSLKLTYLLIFGYTVEIDSYGYVECVLHFEYPPAYPYLLYFLRWIYPNLFFAAVVQTFFFAACAALSINYFFDGKKKLWVALLLGIEPVTSLFCGNTMSECLFVSVLMIWIIFVHDYFSGTGKSAGKVFLVGIIGGVLYSIRFSGILFLLFFVALILADKEKRKYFFFGILSLFIAFQITILPVRIKYKLVFNTYFFNGMTGELLWNNASAIYLRSNVRKNPETDFEKFVAQTDTVNFTTEKAITGRQLWRWDFAYRSYINKKNYEFNDVPKASAQAGITALKIICENPLSYFKNYVVPGFFQIFVQQDRVKMDNFLPYFRQTYHCTTLRAPYYSVFYLVFYFSLLIICSAIFAMKKTKDIFSRIILPLSWLYIISLPFIYSDIRHYFVLAPLILLTVIFQVHYLYKGKTL